MAIIKINVKYTKIKDKNYHIVFKNIYINIALHKFVSFIIAWMMCYACIFTVFDYLTFHYIIILIERLSLRIL